MFPEVQEADQPDMFEALRAFARGDLRALPSDADCLGFIAAWLLRRRGFDVWVHSFSFCGVILGLCVAWLLPDSVFTGLVDWRRASLGIAGKLSLVGIITVCGVLPALLCERYFAKVFPGRYLPPIPLTYWLFKLRHWGRRLITLSVDDFTLELPLNEIQLHLRTIETGEYVLGGVSSELDYLFLEYYEVSAALKAMHGRQPPGALPEGFLPVLQEGRRLYPKFCVSGHDVLEAMLS